MIRRALVAAALATTALVALPAGPAQARACPLGYACKSTYYSDNSYTQVVGVFGGTCDGSAYNWGVKTVYQDYVETPCE
ncbi:hypothetical protein GCM10023194_38420 [Planotetraspora phitsanulokensis]|uniref:Peptidase inhibitor family I36 n=1 Tax=Planotetraspora phitsanulokensis TaxID=575192 RepID=A0A8J3XHJ4_9ACTN|nr:DUF6289 family protein [Planotetraspora phitsanulokensis]GII41195.1 hypothetical protein Pph01_61980 [Planotetraspora phitsanulokensis]